jgi:type IV secretion system protein VirD4
VNRDGLSPGEFLVLAGGTGLAFGGGIAWAGASLAAAVAGHHLTVTFGESVAAAVALPAHLLDPAQAWPAAQRGAVPSPGLYWAATAGVALPLLAALVVGLRRWGRNGIGTVGRRPLGVDARARFASRRDLASIRVKRPTPGRFILGVAGRHLVATEIPATRRRGRQGDRGAVALVGPSRSGKTTAAIAGILEWTGPAICSSVKADLLAPTLGWRSQRGQVRIYDPTGTTGRHSASWSPLRDTGTVLGAQRVARALCDAAPRGGVEGGLDFWLAQAEILLSGLLWIAHHTGRDMTAVCGWVMTQDRPAEAGPGEVKTLLDGLLGHADPAIAVGAVETTQALLAVWEMEERTRSSVYATAQTVTWPWADPGVAAASRGTGLDLDWLLSDANTLYLCAPIEDQRRLAPAFGGLLNDLIAQAYRRVAQTGRAIDPPVLVVLDEAGNTPLRSLPEYASTLAGLGVLLVTIWQSIAQLEVAHGRQADTILTNHLSKVFYAGLSDPASLRYASLVLGDEEVETRSRSMAGDAGRGSLQLATTRVSLAPAHVLRQMRPGHALLVHGTLPPAHIRTRPYYRDRRLAARASLPPAAHRPAPVAVHLDKRQEVDRHA